MLTVQVEDEATVGVVDQLPPAMVGDALVLVGVRRVFEVVVGDGDGEPVPSDVGRQALGNGPGSQDPILLQPEIEVGSRLPVIVKDEDGSRCHALHYARRQRSNEHFSRRVAAMKRLNGVDALLLYSEAPEIHEHTLKIGALDVSGLDEEFSFELFRRVTEPRLLELTPLRYQLVDIPLRLNHSMWVQNDGTPQDRTRPLREMYVAQGLR